MQRIVRKPAAQRRIERAREGEAPRGARPLAGLAPASISAMARRKRAIPSALPPGDIRSKTCMFHLCSCFDPRRAGSQGRKDRLCRSPGKRSQLLQQVR